MLFIFQPMLMQHSVMEQNYIDCDTLLSYLTKNAKGGDVMCVMTPEGS